MLVGTAWALDMRRADGEVVRNTTLAGRGIGGLTRPQLRRIVGQVEERLRESTVRVETDDGDLKATAAELGITVDVEATVEEALDVGRTGSAVGRPLEWLAAVVDDREAPLRIAIDENVLAMVVAERDPTGRENPVEPSLDHDDGRYVAEEGKDGRGLVAADVAEALRDAAAPGDLPIVVDVDPGDLPPVHSIEDAEELADQANSLTESPLPLEAGGTLAEATQEMQRRWLRSAPTSTGLTLTVPRHPCRPSSCTSIPAP